MAGTADEVRSKERSALPRLPLRLLSSFSCASAANCSKYLYLKAKFQRVSVKKKEELLAGACLWTKHLQRESWFPDAELSAGLAVGPACQERPAEPRR